MASAQIEITVIPYMTSGGDPVKTTVAAKIVGELAIHRSQYAWQGIVSPGKEWTVTHIPTGKATIRAFPPRFWDRGAMIAGQRELIAWAAAWQAAAPEFFAAVRNGDIDHKTPGALKWRWPLSPPDKRSRRQQL